MKMLSIILGFLFFNQGLGLDYENVYNFKNHSYWITTNKVYVYSLDWYCGGNYAAAITDSDENSAISSVLRKSRVIGIYTSSQGTLIVEHTWKKATYTNFGPNSSNGKYKSVMINSLNGYWKLVTSTSYQYAICENDKISSSGINITSNRILNIPYDSLLTYRGHSYYIYGVYRSYDSMLQICKNDHNGYIFIPNDGLENCAINSKYHEFVYVGITRIKDTFITDKGYEASYLPWTPGNPKNEVCITRSHKSGEFSTKNCNEKNHIICETDSVVNNATAVDCNNTRKHFYFAQVFQYKEDFLRIFDFEASKEEAKTLCSRRGDVLYVPLDAMENCAVMENSEATLGLNYGQNHVKHVLARGDSYISNYTNWAAGYPTNNDNQICVYAYYESGKWKNDVCVNKTFACREVRLGETSTINCTKNYFQMPSNSYTFEVYTKTYSLFSRLLSFHDSDRLCAYYGLRMVQTSDSYIIGKIIENIVDTNFHIDYRIFWKDTNVTWIENEAPASPNWAPNEPKISDFLISCVSIALNKTWVTNSCRSKYVPVCEGHGAPTMSTISASTSTTTSTTTTSTTSTTTTTTSTSSTTTSSLNNSAASHSSNKVAVGVGTFFGLLAFVVICFGAFVFIKKRGITLPITLQKNVLSSFGSFRRGNRGHFEG